MSNFRNAFSYCVLQVRACDYEHYLCGMHLPAGLRSSFFALRAFNVETARAMDIAKEDNLGLMRLMWRKEAMDGLYKSKAAAVEHPVVTALSSLIKEHRLSKHWFSRILEARISDLERICPKSQLEVETYAESTMAALLYLTLEAAEVRASATDHVASHLGKAEGIAPLLRATPHHSARRKTYIPGDIAAKYGVSQEEIYGGVHSEGLANAVIEIVTAA